MNGISFNKIKNTGGAGKDYFANAHRDSGYDNSLNFTM